MPSRHERQQPDLFCLVLHFIIIIVAIIQSSDAVHLAPQKASLSKLQSASANRMLAWFLLQSIEMSKIILASYPSNQILTSIFGPTETVYV